MSDARTRELERAAAAGDVEARAAWIAARLRAGGLEQERVALAAHVGDPGARLALGLEPDAAHRSPAALAEDLARWCAAASAPPQAHPGWRDQVPVRAALALARAASAGATLPAGAAGTLEAVEAWLRAPSPATARAAAGTGGLTSTPGEALLGLLAWECSRDPRRRIERIRDARFLSGLGLKEAKDACDRPCGALALMASWVSARTGETAALAALRGALADWALDAPWRADP